jgi:hypothetical protein
MRAECETSSDSNTVGRPCFFEGARHSTCAIVLLVQLLVSFGLPGLDIGDLGQLVVSRFSPAFWSILYRRADKHSCSIVTISQRLPKRHRGHLYAGMVCGLNYFREFEITDVCTAFSRPLRCGHALLLSIIYPNPNKHIRNKHSCENATQNKHRQHHTVSGIWRTAEST